MATIAEKKHKDKENPCEHNLKSDRQPGIIARKTNAENIIYPFTMARRCLWYRVVLLSYLLIVYLNRIYNLSLHIYHGDIEV